MAVTDRRAGVAGVVALLTALGGAAQDASALALLKQKRYQEAKQIAVAGAANGDAVSMYVLGQIYGAGWAVTLDEAEAARWLQKAADLNYAPAMNALGEAFESGHGEEQSFAAAAVLYRRSAESGDAEGMNRLGRLYEIGGGVPKDYKQSMEWYTRSAQSGNVDGMYRLGLSYESGKGASPDRQLATEWYRKAAAAGSEPARVRLASAGNAAPSGAQGSPSPGTQNQRSTDAAPPAPTPTSRPSFPALQTVAGMPARIRTMVNPQDSQVYIWIPPGTFRMGCSDGDAECEQDEKPARDQQVETGFWLGRTEVTQAAFRIVLSANPSAHQGDRLPVENVTWNEALDYCTNIGGRLPTEVEWEYAARGGAAGVRYGDLDAIAWNATNGGGATHPVAEKQPNAFGLYDMLGNVWEWVEDAYPGNPSDRILRGGSVFVVTSNVRASRRVAGPVSARFNGRGFRCAGQWPAPGGATSLPTESTQTAAVPRPVARSAPGSPDANGVYRGGGNVSRPILLRQVEPEYSEEARKAKLAGVVVLNCVILADGKPTSFKVVKSLGKGLDEKAIEAVKRWKFEPGRKDGKPVPVAATVEVNFRLL